MIRCHHRRRNRRDEGGNDCSRSLREYRSDGDAVTTRTENTTWAVETEATDDHPYYHGATHFSSVFENQESKCEAGWSSSSAVGTG